MPKIHLVLLCFVLYVKDFLSRLRSVVATQDIVNTYLEHQRHAKKVVSTPMGCQLRGKISFGAP